MTKKMKTKIIHLEFEREVVPVKSYKIVKQVFYACNWACGITESKITKDKSKVTCKNCLRLIENWKL